MAGEAQAGAVPGRRGVFEVDEDAALAELERAWADGGYHGFCVLEHSMWSAISSSGEVLTGSTRTGWTSRSARTGRHCSERIGRPVACRGNPSARGTPPQRGRGRCSVTRISLPGIPPEPEHDLSAFPLPGTARAAAPASDRRPD